MERSWRRFRLGVLYRDDNLRRLAQMPSDAVDLIYLDPPFFSNKHYEVIWGEEAEIRSFEDRWEGGVSVYVERMRERVIELHRILKPTGVIYLHCDWHASHHLRVMLDGAFGANNFLNEIVWRYRKWSTGSYLFQRNHDTILFYAKDRSLDSDRVFNEVLHAACRIDPKAIWGGEDHFGPRREGSSRPVEDGN